MPKRFKRIYLEITTSCNLGCAFCPGTKRTPDFMKLSDFQKIAQNLSNYTDHLYFHVMGEPLLHPNIDLFLEEAFINKLSVNITTNGTFLNDKCDILVKAKSLRQISLSLHSLYQYNKTDRQHLIDQWTCSIKSLHKLRPDIYISIRLWDYTSIDDYDSNSTAHAKKLLNKLGYTVDLPPNISERGIKIDDHLYINQAQQFEWPALTNQFIGNEGYCLGLRDQMAILTDGTVVPCCLDSDGTINLGNIFQHNLENILQSERGVNFYNGFSNHKAVEKLCQHCSYRLRFS